MISIGCQICPDIIKWSLVLKILVSKHLAFWIGWPNHLSYAYVLGYVTNESSGSKSWDPQGSVIARGSVTLFHYFFFIEFFHSDRNHSVS